MKTIGYLALGRALAWIAPAWGGEIAVDCISGMQQDTFTDETLHSAGCSSPVPYGSSKGLRDGKIKVHNLFLVCRERKHVGVVLHRNVEWRIEPAQSTPGYDVEVLFRAGRGDVLRTQANISNGNAEYLLIEARHAVAIAKLLLSGHDVNVRVGVHRRDDFIVHTGGAGKHVPVPFRACGVPVSWNGSAWEFGSSAASRRR